MRIDTTKPNRNVSRYLLILILLSFLPFICPLPTRAQDTDSITTLRRMGKAFADIAEKASPAVVGIRAEKTVTYEYPSLEDWPFGSPFDPFGDDLFDRFFRWRSPRRSTPQRRQESAQGSGFIITADGYVLTSNHLVGEADKVLVKVGEKPEAEVKVIGTDPESDVAVLKIEGDNFAHLELADSDALNVGEWVVAIGNPFGLSHTITAGIVSAKGRSGFVGMNSYQDFIQTDAAINPGNSGGPLLNLDGKVVGINTFIISRTGGFMGVGFAVPINMAKEAYEQLVKTGKVVRGYLGIGYREIDPDMAASLGLKEDTKGVVVNELKEGSPADKAGLKVYDVIVEFEGQPVEKGTEFLNRVSKLEPGTKVQIVVLRDGKREKVTATLGTRPPPEEIASKPSDVTEELGLTVQTLTDDLARRLGYEGQTGVLVTRVESGSEAARKGISPGMLILEVNREPIKDAKEFYQAVDRSAKKGTVLLLISDGRSTSLVALRLPKK